MRAYSSADDVRLVKSGSDYFDVLEEIIDSSKNSIHLQTYIFETDETGKRIVNALVRARRRGVEVFMLLDAFGSKSFSRHVVKQLISEGVNLRFFAPLFSGESIFFGRRLHHKIISSDKNTALIGGINIADKYNESDLSNYPWLDYAALIKGDLCGYIDNLCECMFFKKGFSNLHKLERSIVKNKQGDFLVRFSRNDWIKGKNEIHKSYASALREAKNSITIIASYFIPGYQFRWLLKKAARKGLDVTIIKTARSDSASVELAENYMYAFYLRNRIKIYEWPNSVMHGKVMITDNKWVTVGSYNLNYLSHFISVELNSDIISNSFAKEMGEHLDTILQNDCIRIDKETLKQRYGLIGKFKLWLAYNFHKLVMAMVMANRKFKRH